MWHWEVIFKDAEGNVHMLYGKQEWQYSFQAVEDHKAHSPKIEKYLKDHNAVLVLAENIVYGV